MRFLFRFFFGWSTNIQSIDRFFSIIPSIKQWNKKPNKKQSLRRMISTTRNQRKNKPKCKHIRFHWFFLVLDSLFLHILNYFAVLPEMYPEKNLPAINWIFLVVVKMSGYLNYDDRSENNLFFFLLFSYIISDSW